MLTPNELRRMKKYWLEEDDYEFHGKCRLDALILIEALEDAWAEVERLTQMDELDVVEYRLSRDEHIKKLEADHALEIVKLQNIILELEAERDNATQAERARCAGIARSFRTPITNQTTQVGDGIATAIEKGADDAPRRSCHDKR